MLSSVPSKRALQQFRNRAKSRRISMTTFSEFCDQTGDAVLLHIICSCDDPGDMFSPLFSKLHSSLPFNQLQQIT